MVAIKLRFRILLSIIRAFVHTLVFLTAPIYSLLYEPQRKKLKDPKNPILLKSATEVAGLIRKRQLTSKEVVQAYITQIQEVNPILNAVVCTRFDEAYAEAGRVDQVLDSGKVPEAWSVENAPFLGVPITIKECFAVKGMPNTSGMLSRKHYIPEDDAPVVTNLKRAGMIPLGVTNVSELCMWYESTNLVYGRTRNAYHHGRIVGGSSGGEACIISAAGSICGPGSDIGGSIRMPANFNGIFGHKPTSGIVCNEGQYPIAHGEATTFLSTGPLCRYVDDLMPMFKVMAGDDVKKLKLDEPVDLKKLKYYYMEDDSGSYLPLPVDPQIAEKVRKAAQHFRTLGATVRKVHMNRLQQSFEMWSTKMSTSGNDEFCSLLGDHKHRINPLVEFVRWVCGFPRHTLPAIGLGFGEKLRSSPRVEAVLIKQCEDLKRDFDKLLGADGVFLYPTHPVPAPYHNQPLLMLFNFAYTGVFNILGLPVSSVPMGIAKEGVPIGIQVVGNKYNDHHTIAVTKELGEKFGGWVPPF